MPSLQHEALLQLFKNRPRLAAELLGAALGRAVPEFSEARLESAELGDIQPVEYRADLVIALYRTQVVHGIILEVQLSRDSAKPYVWPVYVTTLRARLRCPVCLLVVAVEDSVARWAATPIELGGEQRFTPCVVGPQVVPRITDASVAASDPELAVLSVMAHSRRTDARISVQMALAALQATAGLDADRAALYVDLVLSSLSTAARRALQIMNPANYQFQSEFARHYFAQGKVEGKAEGRAEGKAEGKVEGKVEGKAELLIKLAALKFGALSAAAEAQIRATGATELERMAERLFSARSFEDLL